jgi:DNA helicase-2/ATP-dependent DNA helicase PcrA
MRRLTCLSISYRVSNDHFDIPTLYKDLERKEDSFAAIQCNKCIFSGLVKAASGGYQAIEEVAEGRLN